MPSTATREPLTVRKYVVDGVHVEPCLDVAAIEMGALQRPPGGTAQDRDHGHRRRRAGDVDAGAQVAPGVLAQATDEPVPRRRPIPLRVRAWRVDTTSVSLAEKHLYESLMAPGLPAVLAELLHPPDWHAAAACRDHPGVNFFPEAGEPSEAARAVCFGCPVRDECLEAGLAGNERGIWGGTSYRYRNRLRRSVSDPAAHAQPPAR